MGALTKWVQESNYLGKEYSEYYRGPGRSRDSEILEKSNFAVALERLGGESDTVLVARSGHWLCGWVEEILVHPSDVEAVAELQVIVSELQQYPVLDDEDYSDREQEKE